jgi:anti-sigma B factor antagonist
VVALRTSAWEGEDGPVMVLSGEADTTTAALLREKLETVLDTGTRQVTIDASDLSFLDSASLRVLVLAARALQGRHGSLVLARPQPLVVRVLEITGADKLIDVQELAGLTGWLPLSPELGRKTEVAAMSTGCFPLRGRSRPGTCWRRRRSLRACRFP